MASCFLDIDDKIVKLQSSRREFRRTGFSQYSPKVRFMGLIETTALSNKLDRFSSTFLKIDHAYHALALHEGSTNAISLPWNKTGVEAWFFGRQVDLGGTSGIDGLSLWPLQWLVSEATAKGLVLEGNIPDEADGSDLFMPSQGVIYPARFKNGVRLNMWDIRSAFEVHKITVLASMFEAGYKGTSIFDENGRLRYNYGYQDSRDVGEETELSASGIRSKTFS